MFRPPETGRAVTVVRLSQVPLETRLTVARRVVRTEGLVGEAALMMLIAATEPRQDPGLLVLVEDAERVCGV